MRASWGGGEGGGRTRYGEEGGSEAGREGEGVGGRKKGSKRRLRRVDRELSEEAWGGGGNSGMGRVKDKWREK